MAMALGAAPVDEVDRLMARYGGDGPGACVLVVKDGETVLAKSYGFADLEAKKRATPSTNYRLASVTKQFTSAAILLLEKDGKLSLDDAVAKWLPSLPQKDVTIRQLMAHTGGLIDYEDVMPADTRVPLHDSDVLRLLASQQRTYFAPGTSYRYSNSGYALLALIVGRASGTDFASFLRERIFVPLGMTRTLAFENGISTVPERAYGYSRIDGGWQRTDQSMTSAVLGDGGIYSSIDDLAKWNAALDREPFKRGFAPQTTTDEPDVAHYGFGWRLTGTTQWHSGETIGFRNAIVRWPGERLTVVVLSNRDEPEPYRTVLAIGELFRK